MSVSGSVRKSINLSVSADVRVRVHGSRYRNARITGRCILRIVLFFTSSYTNCIISFNLFNLCWHIAPRQHIPYRKMWWFLSNPKPTHFSVFFCCTRAASKQHSKKERTTKPTYVFSLSHGCFVADAANIYSVCITPNTPNTPYTPSRMAQFGSHCVDASRRSISLLQMRCG